MKVVKRIGTGEIEYRQIPDFDSGFGVINALQIYGGTPEDYEETEITQEEWDAFLKREG